MPQFGNVNEYEEIAYEGTIEEESGGFTLLPEGDYDFTVNKVTRGRYEGSDRMPACNSVSVELLARLFSTQLTTKGEKHLLDRSRAYFRVVQQVVREGQERGELRTDITANEIVNDYAMFERALMYDWCLSGGEYALARYAGRMMPAFLRGYLPES